MERNEHLEPVEHVHEKHNASPIDSVQSSKQKAIEAILNQNAPSPVTIPKNLGDGPLTLPASIKSKIPFATLEKGTLMVMQTSMGGLFSGISFDLQMEILKHYHLFQEARAIQSLISIPSVIPYSIRKFAMDNLGIGVWVSCLAIGFLQWILLYVVNQTKIGQHSTLTKDYSTKIIHYHIQRNLGKLQEGKMLAILQEVELCVPAVVRELYRSGKVQELNTLSFDSYLLESDRSFTRFKDLIETLIPGAEIQELPCRPLQKNITFALEAHRKKVEWINKTRKGDTLLSRMARPIVAFEALNGLMLGMAHMTHQLSRSEIINFFSRPFKKHNSQPPKKSRTTHTRWLTVKLPKIPPSDLDL